MKRVKLALIGVGGFGRTHVACVNQLSSKGLIELVAFVEPRENIPEVDALKAQGVKQYKDYRDLFANEADLDLVSIASPIHTHVPIASAAFSRSVHVFLEKPPAVRIQDLRKLIELATSNQCRCIVGFHDVIRNEIFELKRCLVRGDIGKVRAVRMYALWRRTQSYYARASWAGKILVNGDYVLDGPLNNSCAHLLNLGAFLSGKSLYEFAVPLSVQGELYRVAPVIEGEDTSCLRAVMDSGVEVCIHVTQAATRSYPRYIRVIGDGGCAEYRDGEGAVLPQGKIVSPPEEKPTCMLLTSLVKHLLSGEGTLYMTLKNSESFLLISNGAYESSKTIHSIPAREICELIEEDGLGWSVRNLEETVRNAVLSGQLLSETGISWAKPSERFSLLDYNYFPTRWHFTGQEV